MKKIILCLLSFVLVYLHCLPLSSSPLPQTTVNAVIGDVSFVSKFGYAPHSKTNETVRLSTHLEYVEKLLKTQVPAEIPERLYPQRAKMIKHLHQYRQAGVFPRQSAYQGRRPHFIDHQGNLCAVGYLIAQTAGLDLAQKVNQKYRYAYV